MAYAPLAGQDGASRKVFLPDSGSGIFLREGLDRLLVICPSCCFVAVRHEVSACTGSDTVPGEPNVCSKIRPSMASLQPLPVVQDHDAFLWAGPWPISYLRMARRNGPSAPTQLARRPGVPTIRPHGQVLDHKNRKTPISKPAANAQRPNVQAETTRTRIRRSSCGMISWDRSVIAAAPPFAA